MYGLPSTQTQTQTQIQTKTIVLGTPRQNPNIKLLQEYVQRNTSILTQLESNNNKNKADERLNLLTSEIRLKIKHIAEK